MPNTNKAPGFVLPVLKDDGTIASAARKEPKTESPYNVQYWRSLEKKYQPDSPVNPFAGEFPPGASELDAVARRDFVKLLGASMGLAGVGFGSSCGSAPAAKKILPYHKNPDGLTVGNALHYATIATVGGVATPLLVTAREGRPVKIEGNPDHVMSRGASGSIEQAGILSLYDPNRAKLVKKNGQPAAKKAMLESVARLVEKVAKKDGGKGVRFLSEPSSSPMMADLKARVREKLPTRRSSRSPRCRHRTSTKAASSPLAARWNRCTTSQKPKWWSRSTPTFWPPMAAI